jgi:hypothetical protein
VIARPRLRVVPDLAVVSSDLALEPRGQGVVRTSMHDLRRFRVIGARAAASFPKSWFGHLVRRIPAVRRLLRDRDAQECAIATAQLRVDHVAVGNCLVAPDKCAELPIASAGTVISVCVTNICDRPIVARILVEGELS